LESHLYHLSENLKPQWQVHGINEFKLISDKELLTRWLAGPANMSDPILRTDTGIPSVPRAEVDFSPGIPRPGGYFVAPGKSKTVSERNFAHLRKELVNKRRNHSVHFFWGEGGGGV
jgi:hypothetical protein